MIIIIIIVIKMLKISVKCQLSHAGVGTKSHQGAWGIPTPKLVPSPAHWPASPLELAIAISHISQNLPSKK